MFKGILKTEKAGHRPAGAIIVAAAFILSAAVLPAKGAPAVLTTIRGGFHGDYAAIVFELDGKSTVGMPVVGEGEISVAMTGITTTFASYRGYKTSIPMSCWKQGEPV